MIDKIERGKLSLISTKQNQKKKKKKKKKMKKLLRLPEKLISKWVVFFKKVSNSEN